MNIQTGTLVAEILKTNTGMKERGGNLVYSVQYLRRNLEGRPLSSRAAVGRAKRPYLKVNG